MSGVDPKKVQTLISRTDDKTSASGSFFAFLSAEANSEKPADLAALKAENASRYESVFQTDDKGNTELADLIKDPAKRLRSSWRAWADVMQGDAASLKPREAARLAERKKKIEMIRDALVKLISKFQAKPPHQEIGVRDLLLLLQNIEKGGAIEGESDKTVLRALIFHLLLPMGLDVSNLPAPESIPENVTIPMQQHVFDDLLTAQTFFQELAAIGALTDKTQAKARLDKLREALVDPPVKPAAPTSPPAPTELPALKKDYGGAFADIRGSIFEHYQQRANELKEKNKADDKEKKFVLELKDLVPLLKEVLEHREKSAGLAGMQIPDKAQKKAAEPINVDDLQPIFAALRDAIVAAAWQTSKPGDAAGEALITEVRNWKLESDPTKIRELAGKIVALDPEAFAKRDPKLPPLDPKFRPLPDCPAAKLLCALAAKFKAEDALPTNLQITWSELATAATSAGLQHLDKDPSVAQGLLPNGEDGAMFLAGEVAQHVFVRMDAARKPVVQDLLNEFATKFTINADECNLAQKKMLAELLSGKKDGAAAENQPKGNISLSFGQVAAAYLAGGSARDEWKNILNANLKDKSAAFLAKLDQFTVAPPIQSRDFNRLLIQAWVLAAGEDARRTALAECITAIAQTNSISPAIFGRVLGLIGEARGQFSVQDPGKKDDKIEGQHIDTLKARLKTDSSIAIGALWQVCHSLQENLKNAKTDEEKKKISEQIKGLLDPIVLALESTTDETNTKIFKDVADRVKAEKDKKPGITPEQLKILEGDEKRAALQKYLKESGGDKLLEAMKLTDAKDRNTAVPDALKASLDLKTCKDRALVDAISKHLGENEGELKKAVEKAQADAKKTEEAAKANNNQAAANASLAASSLNWTGSISDLQEGSLADIPQDAWTRKYKDKDGKEVSATRVVKSPDYLHVNLSNGTFAIIDLKDPKQGILLAPGEVQKSAGEDNKEVSAGTIKVTPVRVKADGTIEEITAQQKVWGFGNSGELRLNDGSIVSLMPGSQRQVYLQVTAPSGAATYGDVDFATGRIANTKPIIPRHMARDWEDQVRNKNPNTVQYDRLTNELVGPDKTIAGCRPAGVFPPPDDSLFPELKALEALWSAHMGAQGPIGRGDAAKREKFITQLAGDKRLRQDYFRMLRMAANIPRALTNPQFNHLRPEELQRAMKVFDRLDEIERLFDDYENFQKPDKKDEARAKDVLKRIQDSFTEIDWGLEAIRLTCQEEVQRRLRRAMKQGGLDVDQLIMMLMTGRIELKFFLFLMMTIFIPETGEEVSKSFKEMDRVKTLQKNFRNGDDYARFQSLQGDRALEEQKLSMAMSNLQKSMESFNNALRSIGETELSLARRSTS